MERLSEKTPAKKGKKRLAKSIGIDLKLKQFLTWLRCLGVNSSEFTRELWKITPEWKEFVENYEDIKKWIDE